MSILRIVNKLFGERRKTESCTQDNLYSGDIVLQCTLNDITMTKTVSFNIYIEFTDNLLKAKQSQQKIMFLSYPR